MTKTVTGGEAIVAALEALGVQVVFGVPSQQNLMLYEALARSTQIRVIGARHEAGAVHAADGYARATGRIGVAVVSTGPGTANAVNGLYEAGFASSPVMLITTQIDRAYIGRNKGFIHDAEGQLPMLQSLTRTARRVSHAHHLYRAILQLAEDILSGRPQPGAIEIPTDVLADRVVADYPSPLKLAFPAPTSASLEAAARLIANAKRPLVWLGGGAILSGSADAIQAFVEHLGAPVVTTANGRSALPTDHPLVVGTGTQFPPFRRLLEAADLVLAVGTRFQAVPTGFWGLPLSRNLVQIDIDASMIGRNYPVAAGIVGDAAGALNALRSTLEKATPDPAFLALAQEVRGEIGAEITQRVGDDHTELCAILDEVLPKERNIVCDATMVGNSWGMYLLPVRQFRGFTYSTSFAIGPGLPLAIGAAVGSARRTVAIHGDGGVMLSLGELAMAAEARAPVTLLVFNNNGYGVLKALQSAYGIKEFAVNLPSPDFVNLGIALGVPSERVNSADGFRSALQRSLAIDGPSLIEIDLLSFSEIRL